MAAFTHLHMHTEYSLLDGAAPIGKLIDRAKELDMKALAITDHGAMYGVVDFYSKAKDAGIKPIIGCEVYTAARTRFDKMHEYDSQAGHLVLLAKNQTGYQNLIAMVSLSYTEGFYYRPRVDMELIEKYHEGLICLSACLAGDVPRMLLSGDYEGAKALAIKYRDLFGKENYYIEIQNHGIEEQMRLNPMLIKLAREIDVGLVATNDCHYINRSDAMYQDVLMCIQMGKTLDDENRMKFANDEFYVKSGDEMAKLFPNLPEAIENTNKIADMCNVEFDFNTLHLPSFDVPEGYTASSYLKKLCYDGLEKRYENIDSTHTDRLEYELKTISSMGYVDYFLIVWDFIRYAKENGIPVGPGRGSGAGSIVAYCLDITTIDPLKYNLLFERFLNPERVSMPDIDTDFCIERRGEVIDYVNEKYGHDHVAQIVTFGKMKAKQAIRDAGRVLDIPLATVDSIAKMISGDIKATISSSMEANGELRDRYENDEEIKRLIDTAKAIEGMPRQVGVHAAGVVITGKPVMHYVPLAMSKDVVITQCHMDNIGKLGLLKMDFLGLRNLTVIRAALDNIKESGLDEPDLTKLTYDDEGVYEMISRGDTLGIFQLESGGMRDFMKELQPHSLEDIIAGISLYRPGPMDQIPRYIRNKNNPDKITYAHPMLSDILDVTYGCIIYQEQVLQIVQKLAGYSLGRADILRRAMSKKKADVMQENRQHFIYGLTDDEGNVIIDGAVKRGVDEKTASAIFDEIMDFASYAFNKSHAAAYAVVAYQTAYLKYFYPTHYMAALMTSTMGDTDKTVSYITDCAERGIKLLPPDINKSYYKFTACGNDIRYGLEAVRNVGHKVVCDIAEEREKNGEFKTFTEFLERMSGSDINKRALESLIMCGAFDSLGIYRSRLLAVYEVLMSGIAGERKTNVSGQLSLFADPADTEPRSDAEDYPKLAEVSKKELLNMEKQTTGLYLSGHPLDDYAKTLSRISTATTSRIMASVSEEETDDEAEAMISNAAAEFIDGDSVCIGGLITAVQEKITKAGTKMAFLALEDLYGSIEVIVFPKTFAQYAPVLRQDSIAVVRGRLSIRDGEAPKIIADSIAELNANGDSEKKLYIKLDEGKEALWNAVKPILSNNRGSVPVLVYFSSTKTLKQVSSDLFCSGDERLINQLSSILGRENVKIK